nr:autoantigen p27 domain-containing protein [Methanoculleus sp. FWC-SCC1]
MAEYLLKGGKMLSKSCKKCGFPLFEYKGETICVVCPIEPETAESASAAPDMPVKHAAPAAPQVSHDSLSGAVEQTLIALCDRIRNEPRPDECLCLMQAVKTGAEALAILRHR